VSDDLYTLIREAESALRKGDAPLARRHLSRARTTASRLTRTTTVLQGDVGRYRVLLERTLAVTLERGLEPVAEQILDAMLTIVGARRGFLGQVEGEGWRLLAGRNLEEGAIHDPSSQVSTSIIAEALDTAQPVVADDAAGMEFAHQASVGKLGLRSVACLPLVQDGRVLGFVYLDHVEAQGLFDEAAVAAVASWLPVASGCFARAAAEDEGELQPLPGVLTRSERMRDTLMELARMARFDVSVLLTGETGTGKSHIARELHKASPRAGRAFVHVNCGAIPEALIESALFGHAKGAFTGATSDTAGHFEAAEGGTLFLDELDSMPLACQVRLLVVLQERVLTRVGDTKPRPVNVRVVAAMGADPFDAIDAGQLREDLYYRLAVFVARLPPLRERPEDLPLLASHFLGQSRERFGLAELSLSEAALDALAAHDWPGNVRELGNTLDRAALLARDGVVERITFQGRGRRSAPGGQGVLGQLEGAARALLERMEAEPALRRLELADAFRGVVLTAAVDEQGSKERAFAWLGQDKIVRSRNHTRSFKRETTQLTELAGALDESLTPALDAWLRG
jgi:transcriptional regulator with GAF, ATPase, and Fis domain